MIELAPAHGWLLVGTALVALEAFGVSGVGLLFAGLGAISVGILLELTGELSLLAQFAWFFGFTAAWAAALWAPLKKFYSRSRSAGRAYTNMVGETALVGESGIPANAEGIAHWSGTQMRARLAAGESAMLPGERAEIVDVEGNMLILKRK